MVVPQFTDTEIGRNGTLILQNVSAEDNITVWADGAEVRKISYNLYEYRATENASSITFYATINNHTYSWSYDIYGYRHMEINESEPEISYNISEPWNLTFPEPPKPKGPVLGGFLENFYTLVIILILGAIVYTGFWGFKMITEPLKIMGFKEGEKE